MPLRALATLNLALRRYPRVRPWRITMDGSLLRACRPARFEMERAATKRPTCGSWSRESFRRETSATEDQPWHVATPHISVLFRLVLINASHNHIRPPSPGLQQGRLGCHRRPHQPPPSHQMDTVPKTVRRRPSTQSVERTDMRHLRQNDGPQPVIPDKSNTVWTDLGRLESESKIYNVASLR